MDPIQISQVLESIVLAFDPSSDLGEVLSRFVSRLSMCSDSRLTFFVRENEEFHGYGQLEGRRVSLKSSAAIAKRFRDLPGLPQLGVRKGRVEGLDFAPVEERILVDTEALTLVPAAYDGVFRGFFVLGPRKSGSSYSDTDMQFFFALGQLIARVLASREVQSLINNEASSSEQIYNRLLPEKLPPIWELDYAAQSWPLRSAGGDFYDFLEFSDGRFAVTVGDVAGKGLPAALIVANLLSSLRREVINAGSNAGSDLAELAARLNRVVFEGTPPQAYSTLFHARYNPKNSILEYVSAGHSPRAFLAGRRQTSPTVIPLMVNNFLLGMFEVPPAPFSVGRIVLEEADVLIVATDGMVEATNWNNDEWGEQELRLSVLKYCERSAQEIVESVYDDVCHFREGAPQTDDITLVAIKRLAR